MSDTGPEHRRAHGGMGSAFDEWAPRVLKALGLVGFGVAIVMPVVGQPFLPALFGGSLVAASGGYLGDAYNALKPDKE